MNEGMIEILRRLKSKNDMTSVTKIPSWDSLRAGIMDSPYPDTDKEAAIGLRVEEISNVEFQVMMGDLLVEIERLVGGDGLAKNEDAFRTAYTKLTNRLDIMTERVVVVREKTGKMTSVEEVLETDFEDVLEDTEMGYIPILVTLIEAKLQSQNILNGSQKY